VYSNKYDAFYGGDPGLNHLGRILMSVRDELASAGVSPSPSRAQSMADNGLDDEGIIVEPYFSSDNEGE
jgi:hypothetical protein